MPGGSAPQSTAIRKLSNRAKRELFAELALGKDAMGSSRDDLEWTTTDDRWLIKQVAKFNTASAQLFEYYSAMPPDGPEKNGKLRRPCFGLRHAQRKLRRSPAVIHARLRKHLQDGRLEAMPPLGLWWISSKRRREQDVAALEQRVLGMSDEQARTLELIVHHGENVFVSGPAGTGKSHALQLSIEALRLLGRTGKSSNRVFVTGSTGIAASNVGGDTLHSFSGITVDIERETRASKNMDFAAERVMFHDYKRIRWNSCDILVVDEISMVSGEFFTLVNHVAKYVRGDDNPFGGVQLIVCGDFLQLPPIFPRELEICRYKDITPDYCFLTPTWKEAQFRSCMLSKPFRQRDAGFLQLLNEVRIGRLSPENKKRLKGMSREVDVDEIRRGPQDRNSPSEVLKDSPFVISDTLVTLCGRNDLVKEANRAAFCRLETEPVHVYSSKDYIKDFWMWINSYDFLAESWIDLRVGAKVILVRNTHRGGKLFANGACGYVVDFVKASELDPHEYKDATLLGEDLALPIVEFDLGDGVPRRVTIEPVSFEIKDAVTQELKKRRIQIPLKHAWALTVHKSQGLTMNAIDVECSSLFSKQHAYVALSRCRTLEGIKLINFRSSCIKTCQTAIEFYDSALLTANSSLWGDVQPRRKVIQKPRAGDLDEEFGGGMSDAGEVMEFLGGKADFLALTRRPKVKKQDVMETPLPKDGKDRKDDVGTGEGESSAPNVSVILSEDAVCAELQRSGSLYENPAVILQHSWPSIHQWWRTGLAVRHHSFLSGWQPLHHPNSLQKMSCPAPHVAAGNLRLRATTRPSSALCTVPLLMLGCIFNHVIC